MSLQVVSTQDCGAIVRCLILWDYYRYVKLQLIAIIQIVAYSIIVENKKVEIMNHVLIVEDDLPLQELFQIVLKREGYMVTVASNGEKAYRSLDVIVPELIILDINLPEISGYEIIRHIRATDNLKDSKVIIASANTFVPQTEEAKLADEILIKPITASQLRDAVKRLTGGATV